MPTQRSDGTNYMQKRLRSISPGRRLDGKPPAAAAAAVVVQNGWEDGWVAVIRGLRNALQVR